MRWTLRTSSRESAGEERQPQLRSCRPTGRGSPRKLAHSEMTATAIKSAGTCTTRISTSVQRYGKQSTQSHDSRFNELTTQKWVRVRFCPPVPFESPSGAAVQRLWLCRHATSSWRGEWFALMTQRASCAAVLDPPAPLRYLFLVRLVAMTTSSSRSMMRWCRRRQPQPQLYMSSSTLSDQHARPCASQLPGAAWALCPRRRRGPARYPGNHCQRCPSCLFRPS
jgi:hypothetical protein